MEDSDEVWITYQEYSLIKSRVEEAVVEDGLEVVIYRNNLYPDYYPIEFNITEELALEIIRGLDGQELGSLSDDCTKFLAVYNALVNIDGQCLEDDASQEAELIRIAQEDIGIDGFTQFRTIPFYKNPDIDKEVVEISQGQIIREIICQLHLLLIT